MKPIIHKLYCSKCKCEDTSKLHKHAKGEFKKSIVQYYWCRDCTREKMHNYYHSLTPEKKKKWSFRANAWNRRQKQEAT